MPNFVSPGVYVIEKDNSEFAPTINSSVVGIVGFASKGPTNKATLITSPQSLVNTFGEPGEGITGQGLEGAIEILEATNSLYFTRAISSASSIQASATVSMGACPAVWVSSGGYGVTEDLYLRIQVYDKNGVAKFTAAKVYNVVSGSVSSTGTQAQALSKVLGGTVDSSPIGSYDGYIVGSYAGSDAYITVDSASGTDFATQGISSICVVNASGVPVSATYCSSVSAYGMSLSAGTATGEKTLAYLVQSLYPGAGYNAGTKSDGTTSGNSVELDNLANFNSILTVNENGYAKENYKVGLVASGNFVEDVIGQTVTDATSEIILGGLYSSGLPLTPTKLTSYSDRLTTLGVAGIHGTLKYIEEDGTTTITDTDSANPRFVKFIAGTYNLTGGTNGIPTSSDDIAAAIIGESLDSGKTGMQTLNDESLNISIAVVPGLTDQRIQNALITLAEATQNFIAVVSPPFAIGGVQQAIAWANGADDKRSAALNSSYAACYWPWVKVYSVYDGADRWYSPDIFGARAMAYSDSVGEVWDAPAGIRKGRLTKPIDVEVRLSQGDRDSLYSGGNCINPIVSFPVRGMMIFGQRTCQRIASSLDRINVRRLLIYLRKVLLITGLPFVFSPNDAITWGLVEDALNPLLDDIKRRRGLYQFKVVCSSDVNTPQRIDQNQLFVKVLLQPVKTAEIIVFELNLTNTAAKLGV